MLDTLRNTYNVGEAFHAMPEEKQALINAAHAAYDAWAHMSRAHFAACDEARALMSNTVPTCRAYVAAFELWQGIEELGAAFEGPETEDISASRGDDLDDDDQHDVSHHCLAGEHGACTGTYPQMSVRGGERRVPCECGCHTGDRYY